jgi:hypothetical protein
MRLVGSYTGGARKRAAFCVCKRAAFCVLTRQSRQSGMGSVKVSLTSSITM